MDLSKAFDCIPHCLIIAKPAAYGISDSALGYIYLYLKNRKQCLYINNTQSKFQNIISEVPQGSMLGPIFFNITINDFFFFISEVSVHNFADDNTLFTFAKTISELIRILESESKLAIEWFNDNKMIVNPDKLGAIIIDKTKSDHANEQIDIDNQQIEAVSSVKSFGVHD